MENVWAHFLKLPGLNRATKCPRVWKSPSNVHSFLTPGFYWSFSGESFSFEVKSLVGEDKNRQKTRGTTYNLQAGCVTIMIWKYCKEQTDPGGSVNSLPCEH